MYGINIELVFSRELAQQPYITWLIRKFGVSVNILRARITERERGVMFVRIEGEKADVEEALKYLEAEGVEVARSFEKKRWDEDKCVHCGACVGHCITGALHVEEATGKVSFAEEECISCELCVDACSFGAITSHSERARGEEAPR